MGWVGDGSWPSPRAHGSCPRTKPVKAQMATACPTHLAGTFLGQPPSCPPLPSALESFALPSSEAPMWPALQSTPPHTQSNSIRTKLPRALQWQNSGVGSRGLGRAARAAPQGQSGNPEIKRYRRLLPGPRSQWRVESPEGQTAGGALCDPGQALFPSELVAVIWGFMQMKRGISTQHGAGT